MSDRFEIRVEKVYGGVITVKLVDTDDYYAAWVHITFHDKPTKAMRKLVEFRSQINQQLDKAIQDLEVR